MTQCKRRHLYRGTWHETCEEQDGPHWHVRCRRCGFAWMQLSLFHEVEMSA